MKRVYGALLFLFLMLTAALPVSASVGEASGEPIIYINPLYADLGIELPESDPDDGVAAASEPVYYNTTAKAADYLCGAMVDRKKNLTFKFYSQKSTIKAALNQLLDDACEADDTTAPDEGDYLRWHFYAYYTDNYDREAHPGGGYDYTFRGSFYYHSTAAQERNVSAKLAEIMALPEIRYAQTEYETIRAIYKYVTDNVTYDYSVYDPFFEMTYDWKYIQNGAPSPFSAYDALCRGTAVCQGYASLIYRMAREAGLSVRFIGGDSKGEGHAWNIVRIGGLYYNLDSTWDAGMPESKYEYFLRGETSAQFPDHTRDPEFRTTEFNKKYPMSLVAYNPASDVAPSEHHIFYELNGGTNDSANPDTYFKEAIALKAPSRVGYLFEGWYTDGNYTDRIKSIPATAAGDYTLYAKWSRVTVGDTKVTGYRANGNGFTVKYQAVSDADGYRILYTHSSDFADEAVEHLDVAASDLSAIVRVADADTPYYVKVRAYRLDSAGKAVWGKKTSKVKGYSIKYKLDGGTNPAQNPYFIYTWKYTLKEPARDGYSFLGWYTDKKFKNKITVIRKDNKKNLTLYARWKKK